VENYGGHILGALHKLIDLEQKVMGWRIVRSFDIPPAPIIVPNVYDTIVLPGDLVAFDDFCKLLRRNVRWHCYWEPDQAIRRERCT
jgi:hypothetical protein